MGVEAVKDNAAGIQPTQLLWKLTDKARQFRQRQTMNPDAALGRRGEDIAHRYLQKSGMTVVGRNYKQGRIRKLT